MISSTSVPIPADVRALIVRQLGKALADRWRQEHRVSADTLNRFIAEHTVDSIEHREP